MTTGRETSVECQRRRLRARFAGAGGRQPPQAPARVAQVRTMASLDRLLFERVRLQILAHLAHVGPTPWMDLHEIVEESTANTANHLRKLRTAGLVEFERYLLGKKRYTAVHLSPAGLKALRDLAACLPTQGTLDGASSPHNTSERDLERSAR